MNCSDVFDMAYKPITEMEQLVIRLKEWANWMHLGGTRSGYPSRAPLFSTGGASKSYDELCEPVDAGVLQAIDTVVQEDIAPAHRAAIHKCYGICSVWRFPRNNYPVVLEEAHEQILRTLKRKGILF